MITRELKHRQCKYEIISNPEFLSEGSAINDCLYPSRVLIGTSFCTTKGLDILLHLYLNWIPCVIFINNNNYDIFTFDSNHKILLQRCWSTELSKLASNAFLAQRISSINSLSVVCEATGANIGEVATSVGLDSRIGCQYLEVCLTLILLKFYY